MLSFNSLFFKRKKKQIYFTSVTLLLIYKRAFFHIEKKWPNWIALSCQSWCLKMVSSSLNQPKSCQMIKEGFIEKKVPSLRHPVFLSHFFSSSFCTEKRRDTEEGEKKAAAGVCSCSIFFMWKWRVKNKRGKEIL